ncbi:ECF transporter S component [Candidatus Bathyarchaeota archaeon]|nr:ECF transporter S component [Candidatus Bathyarchaeota archaeon]MBS7617595.1 ECF transporter S component [Candidatus Bathyarchaeota archaeon]
MDTKRLALISTFTALAVASRVVLSALPNIKLNSFLTMTAGILTDPYSGFLIGSLSMVISDALFFGLGFWSPITAFFMGLNGFLAGLFWHNKSKLSRLELASGGLLLTVFYDLATSILTMIPFVKPNVLLYTVLIGLFIPSPYPMGPAHEFTTSLLMGTLAPSIIRSVRRGGFGER